MGNPNEHFNIVMLHIGNQTTHFQWNLTYIRTNVFCVVLVNVKDYKLDIDCSQGPNWVLIFFVLIYSIFFLKIILLHINKEKRRDDTL